MSSLPLPAFAVMCDGGGVQGIYERMAGTRSVRFAVEVGKLTFDPADWPVGGSLSQTETVGDAPVFEKIRIEAYFAGEKLIPSGGTTSFAGPVTLAVLCRNGRCPVALTGDTILSFTKITTQGFTVEVGLCDGFVIDAPTPDMIAEAKACLRNRECPPLR